MLLERFGVSSLLIFRMNEVISIITAIHKSLSLPYRQQSTRSVMYTTCELKLIINDSLWILLYAVCLYSVYWQLDTLPLLCTLVYGIATSLYEI